MCVHVFSRLWQTWTCRVSACFWQRAQVSLIFHAHWPPAVWQLQFCFCIVKDHWNTCNRSFLMSYFSVDYWTCVKWKVLNIENCIPNALCAPERVLSQLQTQGCIPDSLPSSCVFPSVHHAVQNWLSTTSTSVEVGFTLKSELHDWNDEQDIEDGHFFNSGKKKKTVLFWLVLCLLRKSSQMQVTVEPAMGLQLNVNDRTTVSQ